MFLCYMALTVGISGKGMEGDRGIMLQGLEEEEAKREVETERKRERGREGLSEGRAGTREGGGRLEEKKGREKVEDRVQLMLTGKDWRMQKGGGFGSPRASAPIERQLGRV